MGQIEQSELIVATYESIGRVDPSSLPHRSLLSRCFLMDWDHPSALLRRAGTCSRLAEQSDDPIEAAKLREIAEEYDAKARGLQSPPHDPSSEAEPSAQQHALNILQVIFPRKNGQG